MATSKLLYRFRRCSPTCYTSTFSRARHFHHLTKLDPPYSSTSHLRRTRVNSIAAALGLFQYRFISIGSDDDSEFEQTNRFDYDLATGSNVVNSELVSGGQDSTLPVQTVVSMLDGLHEFTQLPWWIVIASSTLALRVTLFPLLLLQLKKLQKFGQLYHKCDVLTLTIIMQIKAQLLCLLLLLICDCWSNLAFFPLSVHLLKFGFACKSVCCTNFFFFLFNLYAFLIVPPAIPPPLSGKSYINQFLLFRKERRAIGCPSFLWVAAYFSVQIPCFFLWMTSVRKMSLDHHPGFDTGGILWFQDLTEYCHGYFGPLFPLLIAGLHYANIQVSFLNSSVGKAGGLLQTLAKYYKIYLDLLTLPIFFIGYCIPQGSLVYWVTNGSLTLFQQLCLKHPDVRAKLGLLDKNNPKAAVAAEEVKEDVPATMPISTSVKPGHVYVKDLSPKELLAASVQYLSKGQRERAIPLLRLALNKDPDYIRALVVMGQTLLQKGLPAEACEYLERAISKLLLSGHLTEVEEVDLLILASQWAGVAYIRQGKNAEGIAHLERVAKLEEPEDPMSKVHYFDGLVLFASALSNVGRGAEAAKYLRLAAAYNPAYKEYLDQCENDDSLVGDLVNSRRGDY